MKLPDLPQRGAFPPHLHMIWFGKTPAWVKDSVSRWDDEARSTGQEVYLWTEENAPLYEQIRERGPGLSVRATADFVRLALVYLYGGVYLDVDTIPLRPENLVRPFDWIGTKPEGEGRTLINAHFGMAAGSPFLASVWNLAWQAYDRGLRNDHFIAGPRTWRQAYDRALNSVRPTLVPRYPTVTKGPLTRELVDGSYLDQVRLCEAYGEADLVHVVYSRRHAR